MSKPTPNISRNWGVELNEFLDHKQDVETLDHAVAIRAADLATELHAQIIALIAGGGGGGGGGGAELRANTVDTGADYRIILFSDGTVRAIPYATPFPVAPTALARVARLSSVRLTWTASTTPSAVYAIYRDGSQIGTTAGTSYRDIAINVGSTYTYFVRTVDPYGQRSAPTASVTAFINPAINVAPTVTVRAWPPNYAVGGGVTILRVNASDVDAQSLALSLSVDTGTISSTDDPSVWLYTP